MNISVPRFLGDFKTGCFSTVYEKYSNIIDAIFSASIPNYKLCSELKSIKEKFKKTADYKIDESEKSKIKNALIYSSKAFGQNLQKILSELPTNQILEIINDCLTTEDETKAQTYIHNFLKNFSEESLTLMSGFEPDRLRNKISGEALLQDEALKSVLRVKGKVIWRELFSEIKYFMHHIIAIFIGMTGISEFNENRKSSRPDRDMNSYEAKAKLEFYLTMFAYPSILFSTAFALTNSAVAAVFATGLLIISSLAFIPIYIRYLRPCPNEYSGLTNLNHKAIQSEEPPTYRRNDILTRIQNAFLQGKGVILLAGSGEGKTSVVMSLSELIVAGQSKSFLSDALVFSANANALKGSWHESINLNDISNCFIRHPNKFILFLDEIVTIFQEGVNGEKPLDSLLTFHDKFRFVICATTIDQYKEIPDKDKKAFEGRRFKVIKLSKLESKETENALYSYLHFKAPDLIVEDGVIKHIVSKALQYNSQTSEIDAAKSLLLTAIDKTKNVSFETLEEEIDKLTSEIEMFKIKQQHSDKTPTEDEIKKHESNIKTLAKKNYKLEKKQIKLKRIKNIENSWVKLKWEGCQLAAKAEADKNKQENLRAWLINFNCRKILSKFVSEKRSSLGLPNEISKTMIDEIVSDSVTTG